MLQIPNSEHVNKSNDRVLRGARKLYLFDKYITRYVPAKKVYCPGGHCGNLSPWDPGSDGTRLCSTGILLPYSR